MQYNFNGGRRLNRPINANAANGNLIVQNWYNAMTDPNVTPAQKAAFFNNPLAVDVAGVNPASLRNAESGCGAYIPPALVSFFRPSGFNPTLQFYAPPQLNGLAQQVLIVLRPRLRQSADSVQRHGGQLLQRHLGLQRASPST